jgi:hypothetical protein
MSLKALTVDFPASSGEPQVFVGGAAVLNLLGKASSTGSVPPKWQGVIRNFLETPNGRSFRLGGYNIVRNGLYVTEDSLEFENEHHENKGPSYRQLAAGVGRYDNKSLAEFMRGLLAEPTRSTSDPWIVVLTAAMFLSEVVRNPRSFAVNLMLLDLIETGTKYGSAGDKELSFEKLLGFKKNKEKTYTYSSGAVRVGAGNASDRAGKLPMSHLGAVAHYDASSSSNETADYSSFTSLQKRATLNLQGPTAPNQSVSFSNALIEKEATVSIRWLCTYLNKKSLTYPRSKKAFQGWGKALPTAPVYEHFAATFAPLREQKYAAGATNCTGTSTNQETADYWVGKTIRDALTARYADTACLI